MTPLGKALQRVAANMRIARRRSGLTQARLAEDVGVEPRFVRAIESGRQAPSFRTLVAIAHALAIDIRDLFEPIPLPPRVLGRPRARSDG